MENNESEVVAELQSSNWSNFDVVYEKYLPKIYRYIYYRVRHKQTAEDITQMVFLKAVQNIQSFKDQGAGLSPWLYRIARNAVIDHSRIQKPVSELDEAVNMASGQDVMAAADDALKLSWIKEEMKGLTELQQEVLLMRVWDGLSHSEIAAALNISEGNSKISLSRALKALKSQVPIALLLIIISKPNI